ncbi:helix-turn-helix domain-containing protein [Vibrio sp. B1FLJ16]|nr:arabinose operon control protein [Vibrio sp. B1FLJ16]CAE6904903.1 arabinose operon control protein [Vibrio sp. B1FLJ16]
MIEETRLPLSTIAQATGFTSQSYFTKRFREHYTMSPSQLRRLDG